MELHLGGIIVLFSGPPPLWLAWTDRLEDTEQLWFLSFLFGNAAGRFRVGLLGLTCLVVGVRLQFD